jgi:methylglutamate dehydrogenase subunit D
LKFAPLFLSIQKGCASVPEQLEIRERAGFGLATLMARKDVDHVRLREALGVSAPNGCSFAGNDDLALVGTGPGVWMALSRKPHPEWIDDLSRRLSGIASVSDQSGGYVIFRISGPSARSLLQRGVFIDLDSSAFVPGSVATTVIAHIGVILWQVDSTPAFEVALFRSFAKSFRDWIDATAPSIRF